MPEQKPLTPDADEKNADWPKRTKDKFPWPGDEAKEEPQEEEKPKE
jgi:hypothetical protein